MDEKDLRDHNEECEDEANDNSSESLDGEGGSTEPGGGATSGPPEPEHPEGGD